MCYYEGPARICVCDCFLIATIVTSLGLCPVARPQKDSSAEADTKVGDGSLALLGKMFLIF
jgi:hypothetical protein